MSKEYEKAVPEPEKVWSVSMLASFFGKSRKTVSKVMEGVRSTGEIQGNPAYLLQDAVINLFANDYYAEDSKLKPGDRKSFYESELKRVELEEILGQLMRTDDAHKYMSSAFKELDLQLSMLPDNIERSCGITGEQFNAVEHEIDKARLGMIAGLNGLERSA